MTIKSTLSVVALLSGIALSGAAYAQTQVGNNDVSDADLAVVQQHCDALALADQNEDAASTSPADPNEDANSDDGKSGLQTDTEARNTSTTVDLDTITLEDCRTAGLVE